MGGLFGVASESDCTADLFYGTDYHSHLGTRRGGMAVSNRAGIQRAIHNIENSYFRTKFEAELNRFHGGFGIGPAKIDFRDQLFAGRIELFSFLRQ